MTTIKREVRKVEVAGKKADEKTLGKERVLDIIVKALAEEGINTKDGLKFGFTASTVVAELENIDVQVKLITAKSGENRYKLVKEVEA